MITEERAIEELNEIIENGWLVADNDVPYAIPACEMGINSIKAWKKLKEDITRMQSDRMSDDSPLINQNEVLHIIDKYITEIRGY